MEANRPIGCFECRRVMESGVPFHLHGSNLVVDEAFENDLGWDFGCLDGQPFVAEDYVFGMTAYLAAGSDAFGWHGCVMVEQPPFSYGSAFNQRYRWIFGVLQGLTWVRRSPTFATLPRRVRARLLLGTFYRITTFALGAVIGATTLIFAPLFHLWIPEQPRNFTALLPLTLDHALVGRSRCAVARFGLHRRLVQRE